MRPDDVAPTVDHARSLAAGGGAKGRSRPMRVGVYVCGHGSPGHACVERKVERATKTAIALYGSPALAFFVDVDRAGVLRLGLARLRIAVQMGEFDVVVVADVADLTRDSLERDALLAEFRRAGVRLVVSGGGPGGSGAPGAPSGARGAPGRRAGDASRSAMHRARSGRAGQPRD